jgi:hypothetical protein
MVTISELLIAGSMPSKGLLSPPGWILAGIDKYNKKIMIVTMKDPGLFRVENQFTYDTDTKRFGINPLVTRCGINLVLWFRVILIMMSKLVLSPD